MRILTTLLVLLGQVLSSTSYAEDITEQFPEAAYRARIAIIIDDLGYGLKPGQALIEMPFDLTLAVIPFTPFGADLARMANAKQKEVMLHAPMETLAQSKWEPALKNSMAEPELIDTMGKMLDDIPHVKGVNNHGGSKLTQDRERMDWVMSVLAERQLYFVDSRTIASSTAIAAAKDAQIAHRSRDVFLDNTKDSDDIQRQLMALREIALKRGNAIAIGHPYRQTIEALEHALPQFKREGILLVKVSKMLRSPSKTPQLELSGRDLEHKIYEY